MDTMSILTVLGLAFTIIFGILAVFFFFKSKYIAKPMYTISNTILIDKDLGQIPSFIDMTYDGKSIDTLIKTTITFWNAGRKTIDQSDLVPSYFSFTFEDVPDLNIFSIGTANISRDVIEIQYKLLRSNSVQFSFSYLDYKDSFTIEILHTSKLIPDNIYGNIKGVPKGLINYTNRYVKLKNIVELTKSEISIVNPIAILINFLVKILSIRISHQNKGFENDQ